MIKNLKKRLNEQKGLTLVELLAVIVILGVIAAIAVPSIGNIVAKSKFDASKADAATVLNAAQLYMAETGDTVAENLDASSLTNYINGTDITGITNWSVDLVNGVPKITATTANPNSTGSNVTWTDKTIKEINEATF